MTMLGYFDVFPDKMLTEVRTASFPDAAADDPLHGATFIFTEYFCTDLKCDCQRVLVRVLRAESEDARPEEVASINYSWKPKGDGLWAKLNLGLPNPFLDPLHRQVSYATELLDFWRSMIGYDKAYASRIRRHYDEIRAEIGQTAEHRGQRPSTGRAARKSSGRLLSKRSRKLRRQRLARARQRK